MAVRRGVAVGGDRLLLPAARGRARRRARARDAVRHAGARRPARGAGRARALRGVPARDPPRVAPARHGPDPRSGRDRGAGVLGGGLRAGRRRPGTVDLPARLAAHATWTSAATHPILPLLATASGVRLQLATGVAAHRARSGDWGGGLWLPECAHAPWLDPLLEEAGVHATCVDLTDVLGRGAEAQLRPLRSPAGPLLVPIDRAVLELVWSDDGYPSRGPYRDTRALTEHRHQAWAVDGPAYEPEAGAAQAQARRARLRGPCRRAGARRRPVRRGLRHRAARPALARGRGVALGRAGRGRARGAADRAARRAARRGRPGARAGAAGHVVGHAARRSRPGAARRRAGWRGASGRRSCARSRRCRRCPIARCASCSRCSRPTGRS